MLICRCLTTSGTHHEAAALGRRSRVSKAQVPRAALRLPVHFTATIARRDHGEIRYGHRRYLLHHRALLPRSGRRICQRLQGAGRAVRRPHRIGVRDASNYGFSFDGESRSLPGGLRERGSTACAYRERGTTCSRRRRRSPRSRAWKCTAPPRSLPTSCASPWWR